MNKLFSKSTSPDFQKLIQQILTIHKNVLYLTYQVDFIRKKVMALDHTSNLQTQVDDFYKNQHGPDPVVDEDGETCQ